MKGSTRFLKAGENIYGMCCASSFMGFTEKRTWAPEIGTHVPFIVCQSSNQVYGDLGFFGGNCI